jgi:excisionase family DNA binding protein
MSMSARAPYLRRVKLEDTPQRDLTGTVEPCRVASWTPYVRGSAGTTVFVRSQNRCCMVELPLYVRRVTDPIESDEFSRQEAALKLGVSLRTIDRLREDGELESFLVRGIVRIPKESVEAYKARQRDEARRQRERAFKETVKDDFDVEVPFLAERRGRRAA